MAEADLAAHTPPVMEMGALVMAAAMTATTTMMTTSFLPPES